MTKEQWEQDVRAHLHEMDDETIYEMIRKLKQQNIFGAYTDFIEELEDEVNERKIKP